MRKAARDLPPGQSTKVPYLFLIPWFLGMLVLVLAPLAASAYLSLTDYDLIGSPTYIGFENYSYMWDDFRFWKSLKVTTSYVIFSVPLTLVAALGVAKMVEAGGRGMGFFRLVFYLPSLLGASVAIAVVWRQIFAGNGVLNQLLGFIGIQGEPWISDPDYSIGVLVLLAVWQFGTPMVIFVAGLKQIPESLYEAAEIDGATKWQSFLQITIPLLSPVIFFNLVLGFINAFQAFTPAYIISGGTGGPADSTLFFTLYLFQQGFGSLQMGYAAALAWVLVLIVGAITAVNFVAQRYWVFYGDER